MGPAFQKVTVQLQVRRTGRNRVRMQEVLLASASHLNSHSKRTFGWTTTDLYQESCEAIRVNAVKGGAD